MGECILKTQNIRWNEEKDKEFQYIDLSSVSRDTHCITETKMITGDNAPSRAQQIVNKNDILFGTTRPLLKRFCLVPMEYEGQICSTGFCVIRPNTEIVLPKWLYYQVSLNEFYSYVEQKQTGAAYPSISDMDVKKYKIPVPPLEEQERIVKILDRFEALCNDISVGLPAEIKARQQQYEYYRNKLLTFDEVKA